MGLPGLFRFLSGLLLVYQTGFNVDLGVGLEEGTLIPQGGCKTSIFLLRGLSFRILPFVARGTLASYMNGDMTGTFVENLVTKLPL
jgi:hypothetical protein